MSEGSLNPDWRQIHRSACVTLLVFPCSASDFWFSASQTGHMDVLTR